MWVLYLITPWEKARQMGLLQDRIQAGLHSSIYLTFPAKSFGFEAVLRFSAQNQRFSLVAETPKKRSWARAQQKQSPRFCVAAGALTDTFWPWQAALPQVMPGTGSSTALTAHTGTLGIPNVSQAGPHWKSPCPLEMFSGSSDKWGLRVSGVTFTAH